jgi:tetratricopeptide (TPR) repeat protein
MAIVRKELKDVSSSIRSAYQKAQDVVRKNNLDYGIELLKGLVLREPGFVEARAALRDAETRKAASMGGFGKFIASIKMNRYIIQGKSCVTKKPLDAMKCAEEAIALNPKSSAGFNLLADAAENADALFIAIESLEALREVDPDDEGNLKRLAALYEKDGQGLKVLQIRQLIANRRPGDLEAQAALRSAAAMATMEKGRWNEEGGDFKDRLKSKDGSVQLEREERIVRASDDIKEMILHYEQQIAGGDKSIDVRRKLSEFYQRDGRHQDAIASFNILVELIGTLDPTIDKAIEKSNVAIGLEKAEALKAQGAPEEQVQNALNEVAAYRLGRAEERVRTFPNDMQLRYELACIYWELGHVDNALEQFQISQRNPQRRLSSIIYMGRCFHAKGQLDMAVEQLQKAISEMPVMDKDKMEAVYYLGVTFESVGEVAKALDCFKQIYSANVNYLDVAKRIEAGYAKQQPQAS